MLYWNTSLGLLVSLKPSIISISRCRLPALWCGTVFHQMKVGPSLSLSLHHNCCAPPQVLSAGMINSHCVIFNNCSSLLWVSPHCRYCCSLPQWPLLTCPSPSIKTLPLPPFHFFSLHTFYTSSNRWFRTIRLYIQFISHTFLDAGRHTTFSHYLISAVFCRHVRLPG
jgi:hypothetical protein